MAYLSDCTRKSPLRRTVANVAATTGPGPGLQKPGEIKRQPPSGNTCAIGTQVTRIRTPLNRRI